MTTLPGLSWKQHRPSGSFDAIVIGSGMGGLTCAALLARHAGWRVLVLEQHYRIGGYTHTFTRRGYEWDVGVHYIGQVGERGALKGAFDRLTDGRLTFAPLPEVYDRIELGDRGYDFHAGRRAFVAHLSSLFPAEEEAIAGYVDLVRTTARASSTYLLARGLPTVVSRVVSPLMSSKFRALAARTTAEVLGELTRNEELAAVLTGQYGDYGLPPRRSSWAMHAALVAHYLGGGYYPVGGSSAFPRSLAPVIEEKGGHLATAARVEQIAVERGRAVGVRLEDGTELRAKVIISDAGFTNTFGSLLPEQARPARWLAPARKVSRSSGYLALYLGFRHTDAELGLTGTNLWLYPDHRHDENVARYEADPQAPFPMLYLSFPSAKDPQWGTRFPGRATVDVITMGRYEWFEPWKDTRWRKRGPQYEALKASFHERLLEATFRRLPQLRGKVDVAELSTPLSTAHFAGHERGELYGLDHGPTRYQLPVRARTPVDGLYLTGADLATAGVAGAFLGGVITASALLGPRLIPRVLWPDRTPAAA